MRPSNYTLVLSAFLGVVHGVALVWSDEGVSHWVTAALLLLAIGAAYLNDVQDNNTKNQEENRP